MRASRLGPIRVTVGSASCHPMSAAGTALLFTSLPAKVLSLRVISAHDPKHSVFINNFQNMIQPSSSLFGSFHAI